jgi:hypothetical protein
MNAKATRTLFTAVALSALAAVVASSAQARSPEGNGTQPPSKTVVNEQQSPLAALLASSAQARSPEGNGTQPPSSVVEPRLARYKSRSLSLDAEICANLDRAIRVAIQQCLSHPVPLAAKQSTQPIPSVVVPRTSVVGQARTVRSIMDLTPGDLAGGGLGGYALPSSQSGSTLAEVLASMSPQTRRYTKALMGMTFEQLAAGAAGQP